MQQVVTIATNVTIAAIFSTIATFFWKVLDMEKKYVCVRQPKIYTFPDFEIVQL